MKMKVVAVRTGQRLAVKPDHSLSDNTYGYLIRPDGGSVTQAPLSVVFKQPWSVLVQSQPIDVDEDDIVQWRGTVPEGIFA